MLVLKMWQTEKSAGVPLTNPATIIRVRARIQNKEHVLLPTSKKVQAYRKQRQKQLKKFYRD
jgi:hypothetical protein